MAVLNWNALPRSPPPPAIFQQQVGGALFYYVQISNGRERKEGLAMLTFQQTWCQGISFTDYTLPPTLLSMSEEC